MDKRGNLQNVGYPVFFTPGAIAKLSFICDGEVTIIALNLHQNLDAKGTWCAQIPLKILVLKPIA